MAKKFFNILIIAFFFANFIFCNFSFATNRQNIDFETIYNNTSEISIYLEDGEDPQEVLDYQNYAESPYTLLRLSSGLIFKKTKIPAGYYLLDPVVYDGRDVVLFKQNRKVIAVIPVYEKQKVDNSIYPEAPKPPAVPLWKKVLKYPFKPFATAIKWMFFPRTKDPRVKTPPKCLLESFDAPNDFFVIYLYVENLQYKMVFKTKQSDILLPMPKYEIQQQNNPQMRPEQKPDRL
ncbi:MAG: hypothetical protein PHV68_01545 [Candidatus Gastranaerophilales bacterium]|nr:hypothetical protein [Candidatus Gastranaerophilales bacterium]